MGTSNDGETVVSSQPQVFRAPAAAAVAGLLFFAFYVGSSVLIHRGMGASPVQALTTTGLANVSPGMVRTGLYLMPFMVVTFLWFIGVARTQFGRHEDQLFTTVFLGTGYLSMAMVLVGAGLATAAAAKGSGIGQLDAATRSLLARTIWVFWYVLAPKVGGCFILVTTSLLFRVKFLPKWLTAVSVVVGYATLLAVTRFSWSLYALPCWVAAISLLVLVREYGPAGRRAAAA